SLSLGPAPASPAPSHRLRASPFLQIRASHACDMSAEEQDARSSEKVRTLTYERDASASRSPNDRD
ncbi:MAG: hypothetical protein AABZ55_00835, partial [Bdellovibrionota bacterium]